MENPHENPHVYHAFTLCFCYAPFPPLPSLPNFRLRDVAADHVQLSDPEAQFVGHAGPTRALSQEFMNALADQKKV